MEELREYYVDQMNGTLDNSTEDFYQRFNEIKEKLTAQKSRKAYQELITLLKNNARVVLHQEIITYLKNRALQ